MPFSTLPYIYPYHTLSPIYPYPIVQALPTTTTAAAAVAMSNIIIISLSALSRSLHSLSLYYQLSIYS